MAQVNPNYDTLEAQGTLDGTEVIPSRKSGKDAKTTVEDILTYIQAQTIGTGAEGAAPVNAVASTGTFTVTDVLANNETLTIGSVVYRFRDTLAAAYDVKIGVSAAVTLDNLKAAINASGTPGTEYFAGTLIHPTVTATDNANDSQVVAAKIKGVSGDLIATTTTAVNGSWGDTTLGSGVDGTVGVFGNMRFDGTNAYFCTADNTVADANWYYVAITKVS